MTQHTEQLIQNWFIENSQYLKEARPSRIQLLKKLSKQDINISNEDLSVLIKKYKPFSRKVHSIETVIIGDNELQTVDVSTFKPKKAWFNGKNWNVSLENSTEINLEAFKEDLFAELKNINEKPLEQPASLSGKTLLVYSLPDLHIGKVPTEEIQSAVFQATVDLFNRFDYSKNNYHILFVIGNDLLNTDFEYRTTKGTPQFDYISWQQSFKDAVKLLTTLIDYLRDICTLDIINIPGNHDRNRGLYLGEVIQAYYKKGLVDNEINPRKYYKFGNVLLGFDHGELKATEYPLLMVTENPIAFSETKYHEIFLGHLHSEQTVEHKGFKMRYLPSLTNHRDDWHVSKGYINNKRSALIYKYDYERGLIGTEVFNIIE